MDRTNQHRISRAVSLLGLLMLAVAVLLAWRNVREANRAGEEALLVCGELRAVILSAPPRPRPDAPPSVPAQTGAEESGAPSETREVVELGGRAYLGLLSVPALALELPILETCTEDGLKHAPCRYSGAASRGDLVIAGHNYPAHFGALKQLSAGDEVLFLSAVGEVYAYRVESMETLEERQVEEMLGGDWDLTLFTCTVPRTNRLAVRCVRAEI